MSKPIVLHTTRPLVSPISQMELIPEGILEMAEWIRTHRPECVPAEGFNDIYDLLPHDGTEEVGTVRRRVSDNELLVEIAGRSCYHSFAEKAGRRTNKAYIENTQQGDIPHGSIMYHAKMTFFIAGISLRVARDLIRHYVGADRDEEGSPSQESTRFTHHYGWYILHPKYRGDAASTERVREKCQRNYDDYLEEVNVQVEEYRRAHGVEPRGLARKRIYEASATTLNMAAETSFVWTTNPIALAKMVREREHEASDVEFQELARELRLAAVKRWPNLFPQPWMRK